MSESDKELKEVKSMLEPIEVRLHKDPATHLRRKNLLDRYLSTGNMRQAARELGYESSWASVIKNDERSKKYLEMKVNAEKVHHDATLNALKILHKIEPRRVIFDKIDKGMQESLMAMKKNIKDKNLVIAHKTFIESALKIKEHFTSDPIILAQVVEDMKEDDKVIIRAMFKRAGLEKQIKEEKDKSVLFGKGF